MGSGGCSLHVRVAQPATHCSTAHAVSALGMPACNPLLRESLLCTCCITQLRQPLVTAPAVSVRACCRPGRAPACGGPTQPADAQPTHPSSCQPSCHPAAAPAPQPVMHPPSPRPAPTQPPPSPHPAVNQPPLMMMWLSVRVLRSQGKGGGRRAIGHIQPTPAGWSHSSAVHPQHRTTRPMPPPPVPRTVPRP